jgi:hypothetical protein
VIAGVIASTMLTLVVIPTVYEIMEEWRSQVLARFARSGCQCEIRVCENRLPGWAADFLVSNGPQNGPRDSQPGDRCYPRAVRLEGEPIVSDVRM